MAEAQSIFFKLPKTRKEGFFLQYDDLPYFYDQLHHHPEFQLVYIIDGTGDLYVKDSINSFGPGDLFLIGANQPHIFKSDPEFFEEGHEKKSRSISVFFNEQSLGKEFFEITEMTTIHNLMRRAERGLRFSQKIAESIGTRMKDLREAKGVEKINSILDMLNELAQTTEYKYLAKAGIDYSPTDSGAQRLNRVVNYIQNNYDKDIDLSMVAEIAHYSKAEFCKFFKDRTRKTFSEFLNEVRISQACTLLKNTNWNISRIGYECGYNNISHFNRQFKRHTGMTPSRYAKKIKRIMKGN